MTAVQLAALRSVLAFAKEAVNIEGGDADVQAIAAAERYVVRGMRPESADLARVLRLANYSVTMWGYDGEAALREVRAMHRDVA